MTLPIHRLGWTKPEPYCADVEAWLNRGDPLRGRAGRHSPSRILRCVSALRATIAIARSARISPPLNWLDLAAKAIIVAGLGAGIAVWVA